MELIFKGMISFVELGMGISPRVGASFQELVIRDEWEHEYALWELQAINNNQSMSSIYK